jgi:hypothetical protein
LTIIGASSTIYTDQNPPPEQAIILHFGGFVQVEKPEIASREHLEGVLPKGKGRENWPLQVAKIR